MTFLNGFPGSLQYVYLLTIAFFTGRSTRQLQQDLDQLTAWEYTWLMSFNPSKYQLLHITKRRSPIQYDYTLHDHVLEQVSTAKYLSLNLHEQLSWNFHTDATAKKANKIRSFVARNVHFCPKKVKVACYTTLVRPAIEYMPPLLEPLILHRIVINCNRSSDVLLGLHVTGTKEQPA